MAESKTAAWVSALAAAVSAGFAYFAWDTANESNDKADALETERRASAVYLGEASGTGQELPPDALRSVWIVVNNASSTQINGVWVEGKNGTSILIDGIPSCERYALDGDFDPVAVHYNDTQGQGWRRTWDSLSDEYQDPPAKGTDTHDSPWWEPIETCSG
jgi:hypothetical protein